VACHYPETPGVESTGVRAISLDHPELPSEVEIEAPSA